MNRPIDRTLRRIPNLFPFLLALISLSLLPSSNHSLQAVRAFATLTVVPVLMPVCGLLSQKLASGTRRLCRLTSGMLVLYGAMSVLVFWAKAISGHGEAFQLFTHVGAPWFFLTAALCHGIAGGLEWASKRFGWKKRVFFVVILGLSLLSGYLPMYRDILCAGRLTLCLPLFLTGRWMDPYALANVYLRDKRLKTAGLLFGIGALAAAWLLTEPILSCGDVLLGILPYAKGEPAGYALWGGCVRLMQILGGGLLTLTLLSVTPEGKIPVFSGIGRRFYAGYFWHAPVIYLLSMVDNGTLAVDLLRMTLILVVPLLMCTSPFQYPVRRLAMSITALLWDGDDSSRPGRPSPAFWFYCLSFGLLVSMYAGTLVGQHKTFLWKPDGEDLYITIMYYTRDYVVGVFKTLFTTGRFVLPQYDLSIGQGAGILSVLHVNPLFLPALLLPRSMMEQVYGFYALGQLFLAGLAFRYFAFYLGIKKEFPLWVGALTYSFSGFCIFTAAKHIYFVTYLVIGLPLLLAGCERWLQKRRWGLFVATVVVLFLGGYYYTWMDSLLMAVYLIVREIHLYRTNLKKMLADCFQLLGFYLWGFGLSMVFFLPAMSNLFGSSRAPTADGKGLSLLVTPTFARKVVQALFCIVPDGPNWTRLGFIGVMLAALVVLFLRLRERRWAPLRILALLLGAFLFLPVMGSVFNGFGYTTNRWSYGIALLNSVILAVVFPHLTALSRKEKAALCTATAVFCGVMLYFSSNRVTLLSVLMLAGCSTAVLWSGKLSPQKGQSLLALVTVFALLVNCGYYFRAYGGQNASAYLKKGQGEAKYTSSPEAISTGLEEEPYRVELPANRSNTFCLTGGNGTSTYWSVLDGTQVNYYLDFELDSVRQVYSLWGLDQRAELCAVASVKYYVDDQEEQIPYGFTDYREDEATGLTVYQNQFALPMGYTYSTYISREDYDALEPLQRQQALLQGAVVEEAGEELIDGKLDRILPRQNEVKLPWKVLHADGVELEGSSFRVTKANATLTMGFDGVPDSETYLAIKGLTYSGQETEASVLASGGTVSKKAKLYRPGSLYAFQREGTTWNLGYHEVPLSELTLTFDTPGQYQADEVSVVCLPMSDYTREVSRLGEVVLQEVSETLNGGITGTIETEDTRLLAFSVPWSSGWTLTLNGQPAALMKVNGMYMGTLLKPGSYEVELTYRAPGMVPGAAVTGISLVGLLGYGIFVQMKKHAERNEK